MVVRIAPFAIGNRLFPGHAQQFAPAGQIGLQRAQFFQQPRVALGHNRLSILGSVTLVNLAQIQLSDNVHDETCQMASWQRFS